MGLTIDKCIEGWTNFLKQLRIKADIVFFGDSLTYYGDFASVFPDKVVCNLGLRGDNLVGMGRRVEQIRLLNPEVVYLMGGLNDVASLTVSEFQEQYVRLLGSVKASISGVSIVVQGLLPVNNEDFKISCDNEQISRCNNVISSLCSKYGLEYVDLYKQYAKDNLLPKDMTVDGIHLRSCAYETWYNLLKA